MLLSYKLSWVAVLGTRRKNKNSFTHGCYKSKTTSFTSLKPIQRVVLSEVYGTYTGTGRKLNYGIAETVLFNIIVATIVILMHNYLACYFKI